jgi:hypothetical protein
MTMHDAFHPDDERLAAYASADREAVSDRELVAHLSSCERCRPIVDDLTLLRDALALLPDLAPSRPLRLIPPVPEPAAARSGALGWLRRLAAPAMAAGAGLVLVGAVGASGLVAELTGKTGDRNAALEASATDGDLAPEGGGAKSLMPGVASDSAGYAYRSDDPRSQVGEDSVFPAPSADEGFVPLTNSTEEPWLTLLVAGFGLFGISAILRYSLTPRAG